MNVKIRSLWEDYRIPAIAVVVVAAIIFLLSSKSNDNGSGQRTASGTTASEVATATTPNPGAGSSTSTAPVIVIDTPESTRVEESKPPGTTQAPSPDGSGQWPRPADTPQPELLDQQLSKLVSAYYGRDSRSLDGVDDLKCASVVDTNRTDGSIFRKDLSPAEKQAFDYRMTELLGQVKQNRDGAIANLVVDGTIADALNGNTGKTIQQSMSDNDVSFKTVGDCGLFSTRGVLTAAPAASEIEYRPQGSSSLLYMTVPVQLTLDGNAADTGEPFSEELNKNRLPVIQTWWQYTTGRWTLVYFYTSEGMG